MTETEKTEKIITLTIEWDGQKDTRRYKRDGFLMVIVDKYSKQDASATFIFGIDPSNPTVCYF